jgi:iron complex transport system substrate-binding protein
VVKETENFYKKFFDYTLTDDDAQRIINAEPPK